MSYTGYDGCQSRKGLLWSFFNISLIYFSLNLYPLGSVDPATPALALFLPVTDCTEEPLFPLLQLTLPGVPVHGLRHPWLLSCYRMFSCLKSWAHRTLACVGRLVTSACLSVSSELFSSLIWLLPGFFCLLSAAEIIRFGATGLDPRCPCQIRVLSCSSLIGR